MNNSEKLFFELMEKGIFEIDEEGRVWRIARYYPNRRPDQPISPIIPKRIDRQAPHGYMVVPFSIGAKVYNVRAHRLVWIKFFGDIPEDLEVNHRFGIKIDNRPTELELMTRSENMLHASHSGLLHPVHGEDCHNAKLTEVDVMKIRERYAAGNVSQRMLAQERGVNQSLISQIVTNKIWRHLPAGIPITLPTSIPMSETIMEAVNE